MVPVILAGFAEFVLGKKFRSRRFDDDQSHDLDDRAAPEAPPLSDLSETILQPLPAETEDQTVIKASDTSTEKRMEKTQKTLKVYISQTSAPNAWARLEIDKGGRIRFKLGAEPDLDDTSVSVVIKLGDDIEYEVAPDSHELVVTWPERAPAFDWSQVEIPVYVPTEAAIPALGFGMPAN